MLLKTKHRFFLATLIILLLFGVEVGNAANLTFTPSLQENFEFDTNPLLRPSDQAKTLFGFTTQPELAIADKTPSQSLYFDTRFDVSRFNLPKFSSSDAHTNFNARSDFSDGFLQLNGYFDYDTTRTSEILASGFNEAGIRHTGLNLSPEVGFQLLPLDMLTVQGVYQIANYDDNSGRLTDYEVFEVTPTLTHVIDANNSAIGTIQASYYKTTSGSPGDTKSAGPGLGWQHKFTAPVSLNAVGGYQYITFNQLGIHSNKGDYFFNVNLSYIGLSDTLSLTLARELSPEATTLQITTTSVAFQELHAFTPRATGTLNINYEDDDVSIFAPGQQTKFIEALASLKYDLTETLAVSVGYRFREEKRINDTSNDNSNAVLVHLIISPGKFF